MNKEKFLPAVTIFFCIVIAFLFYQIIYAPIKTEIAEAQMNTRRLQTISRNLEDFQKRHGDLEKFSALIESRLIDAKNYLPADAMQENFVAELYRISDTNKILVNSIQIGELEPAEKNSASNENLFKLSVKINFEADYISTIQFLREILNGNRLATLENFSLDSANDTLKGELEISIFNLAASG